MFSARSGRRVVVTGLGLTSPAGGDLGRFWDTLYAGHSFVRPLCGFSIAELPGLLGAEADLSGEAPIGSGDPADRAQELVLRALRAALRDASLVPRAEPLARAGVVLGTTLGEERQVARFNEARRAASEHAADAPERGLSRAPARGALLEQADNHRLAVAAARYAGARGPVFLNATACSSGNAALAWGYDLIATGAAELVIAGGVDTLTRLTYCGFRRLNALTRHALRPFHRARDGVAFGEGAGVLVLEELEHARQRGVPARAELAGYGASNDAHHLTAPEPSGEGVVRAVRQALSTSGMDARDVDYVSAHGTGTPYNDAGEAAAMRVLFGERAGDVPISSIKSMLGHTNGAASAIEAIACVLMLERQAVLPTALLDDPDPAFAGLNFVPLKGRPAALRGCLNLAAGFGGFNVCTLLRKAP